MWSVSASKAQETAVNLYHFRDLIRISIQTYAFGTTAVSNTVTAPAGKRMISVLEDPSLRVLATTRIMLFPAGTVTLWEKHDFGPRGTENINMPFGRDWCPNVAGHQLPSLK